MNYDTANRLAEEIKTSEEYMNFKMAKQAISLNTELKKKIDQFEIKRYEAQILEMQSGKADEGKMKEIQDLYSELIQDENAKRYFDAEMRFNLVIADINKIIGDSIKELMQ